MENRSQEASELTKEDFERIHLLVWKLVPLTLRQKYHDSGGGLTFRDIVTAGQEYRIRLLAERDVESEYMSERKTKMEEWMRTVEAGPNREEPKPEGLEHFELQNAIAEERILESGKRLTKLDESLIPIEQMWLKWEEAENHRKEIERAGLTSVADLLE